jgi:hypothetical protein
MANKYNHIADVKVGKVRGNSRTYPQLRLPSQYAELIGQKASIYQVNGLEGDTAFFIRFGGKTESVAAYYERAERLEGLNEPADPFRGSDSGSNPDSGASFLLSLRQQNATVASKKVKPEFKLPPQPNNTGISTLILPFTREDLIGYLELRSAGLASKSITWFKKSARLLWNATNGFISVFTLQKLRNHVRKKYHDIDAKRKVLQFAREVRQR